MQTSSKLANSVRLALMFGATATMASVAIAQDTDENENKAERVERIQVTGSRIRSADLETSQPVQTINRDDIESQGFTSVTDLLDNLSSTGAPVLSRSSPLSSGEEVGGSFANMRGLGANRTLVLVNGKRLGISTGGMQDISAIPMGMVERIEVLKDGASSIYGSDAMAGVINIITRQNYEGAELSVYTGEYSQGDGAKTNVSFVMGTTGERSSVTFGAEWRDEKGVWAKDRWYTAKTYPLEGIEYNNTLVGQYGRFYHNDKWWVAKPGTDALTMDDFEEQTLENGSSNAQAQMHLITPVSAKSVYLSANYDFSDKVTLTTDVGYTQRDANRQVAGYPYQSTSFGTDPADVMVLSADSYFNPTGEDLSSWSRRGWEVPRVTSAKNSTLRFTSALEGMFEVGKHYFYWDVGSLFSESSNLSASRGDFLRTNTELALGPSFMNASGQVQCGTEANPVDMSECTAWNPFAGFGAGAFENSLDDPDVQRFLFPTLHYRGKTKTAMYFANISGLVAELPAGDMTFATGVEYRKESGDYAPDALAQLGLSTTLAAGPTQGEYTVKEAYAELEVPLLSGVKGADELVVNFAARFSDYDTFGDTTNGKVGVKWRPTQDLLVRATWAEGFRAPTISDLYGGGSETFSYYADPCDTVFGDAKGSARCLADGLAADFRQLKQGGVPVDSKNEQSAVPFVYGANPLLEPEESTSKTIGFVYSPSFVENLDVTLDWWSIKVTNTMVGDSPNEILKDCYINSIESRCDKFERDPVTGVVSTLSFGDRNAGFEDLSGLDLGVRYKFTTSFGDFVASTDTTYMTKWKYKSTDDESTPVESSLGFGSDFRLRSNLGLAWTLGDFTANWAVRHFSSMTEFCLDEEDPKYSCNRMDYVHETGTDMPMDKKGSTTFNDVQLTYRTPWEASFSVGANNVFNKVGPTMYSQPSAHYSYYGGFDTGRFTYVRYTQRF